MRLQFTNRRAVNIRGADSDVSGTAYADEPQSLIHGSDKGENLCLHGRTGRLLS